MGPSSRTGGDLTPMLIRAASTVLAAGIVTALLAAAPVNPDRAPAKGAAPAEAQGPRLEPRKPQGKERSADLQLPVSPSGERQWTGRLAVKFRDDLKVRIDRVPSGFVRTASEDAAASVAATLQKHSGSIRAMFRAPDEKLVELEARAAKLSGKAQPDLRGYAFVDVAPDRLLDAARDLNELDSVEYVHIERRPVTCDNGAAALLGENASPQYGCGTDGPGVAGPRHRPVTPAGDARCAG